jgi:alpha-L-fucosidase
MSPLFFKYSAFYGIGCEIFNKKTYKLKKGILMKKFNDERDWFFDARFGFFIHWGIYAIPGWHEQHLFRMGVSRADYQPLKDKFNPEKFDPNYFIDMAEQAGMRYICFTTKHIDGFCMWKTKHTEFNVMNTPYGKDILKQLADACRKRNMPLCLYYSFADMNHPNYPNEGRSYENPKPQPGDESDLDLYVEYMKNHIREICSNYGKIHGFWWDANTPSFEDESINVLIRELQPGIIINNRGADKGDFSTPEREYYVHADGNMKKAKRYDTPTEACESIGAESWSYRINEDYFSKRTLLGKIDKHLAKGGNYLLNAGPKADGTFPKEAENLLKNIGDWVGRVKEALFDAEPEVDIFEELPHLVTRKGNTLYIHLRDHDTTGLKLNPIAVLPEEAILLNDSSPLHASIDFMPSLFRTEHEYLHISNLPIETITDEPLIIKLVFSDPPEELLKKEIHKQIIL